MKAVFWLVIGIAIGWYGSEVKASEDYLVQAVMKAVTEDGEPAEGHAVFLIDIDSTEVEGYVMTYNGPIAVKGVINPRGGVEVVRPDGQIIVFEITKHYDIQ